MPSFAVRLLRALPSRSRGLRFHFAHQKHRDSDNDRDEYQDAQVLGRVRELHKEDYYYRGNDAERIIFFILSSVIIHAGSPLHVRRRLFFAASLGRFLGFSFFRFVLTLLSLGALYGDHTAALGKTHDAHALSRASEHGDVVYRHADYRTIVADDKDVLAGVHHLHIGNAAGLVCDLIVLDAYLNSVFKSVTGAGDASAEPLRFLTVEPVAYLDSIQAEYVDGIMENLKAELGVESTRVKPPDKPFSQLYTINKLIELVIVYRRYIMSHRDELDTGHEASVKEQSILSYLYAHSAEKLTLSQVAEAFFLSESALSKQISGMTGTSFSKLLSSIRVEKASDYLIYTDLTLDEIAKLCGFVDASHVSKHFAQRVGITPMQYRKIYSKAVTKFNISDKAVAFALTDYIYKNYETERLSAASVAAEFNVSVPEMNRLLLYYNEMNFDTLLNSTRVNKACELLVSTDYLVIDVAIAVGYSNIKTFNMNFYRFKEMTPTEFRERITLQRTDGSEASGKGRGGRRRASGGKTAESTDKANE